ncbi:MAG: hypothetical protein NC936_03210 [Candidatus Omnitrophica bacterium]|nr:hypothetical protein [Candidatus Omnitrophota bacterium]
MKMWLSNKLGTCSRKKKRGQALVELSILGAVIIMLLVWMLGWGQSLSATQTLQMYSFRQAERLARQRSKNGKLGSVTFTTVTSLNPINPVNIKPSANEISASGSVMWENELFAFATKTNDVDNDDAPITYYQIGDKMIQDGQAFVWPTMVVEREVKKHSRNYKGQFFNLFAQAIKFINEAQSGEIFSEAQTYCSLESLPTWDTVKEISENYIIKEKRRQQTAEINFDTSARNTINTKTTFKVVPKNLIEDWDDEIEEIKDMDYLDQFSITQTEIIEAQKQW